MRYIPGPYDETVDATRVVELLAKAAESDPAERAEIERQTRRHLRRERAKVKQEKAVIEAGIYLCEFSSFHDWVTHARSWLGGISGGGCRYKPRERCVCVDAKGRICRIGADFMRARDDGAFPVKAYRK